MITKQGIGVGALLRRYPVSSIYFAVALTFCRRSGKLLLASCHKIVLQSSRIMSYDYTTIIRHSRDRARRVRDHGHPDSYRAGVDLLRQPILSRRDAHTHDY